MSEPLAYLLTWTCYGTWLHGDRRGGGRRGAQRSRRYLWTRERLHRAVEYVGEYQGD